MAGSTKVVQGTVNAKAEGSTPSLPAERIDCRTCGGPAVNASHCEKHRVLWNKYQQKRIRSYQQTKRSKYYHKMYAIYGKMKNWPKTNGKGTT